MRVQRRAVDGADGFGVQAAPIGPLHLRQTEGFFEELQGIVPGAVVHDDHFILLIVELQEVSDRLQDGGLLVVGGHDQRNGHHVFRVDEPAVVRKSEIAKIPAEAAARKEKLEKIAGHNADHVNERDIVDRQYERDDKISHVSAASSALSSASPMAKARISMAKRSFCLARRSLSAAGPSMALSSMALL